MYWNVVLRCARLWVILSLAAGHLTEQEKSTIVDMHNELRSKVQPSAAFMQKVVWDETLRLVAEAHVAKCIWVRNPQLKELKMGENLFVDTGPFNATKAMMDWFGEHVDYDFETNNCPEDKMCGHYTQMAWADSNKIGCAAQFCDKLEHLNFEKVTLFVCNYYPQGNIEEQKPYESGVPCSRCPDNLPVCEDNMCELSLLAVVKDLFHPSKGPGVNDTEEPTVLPKHPRMMMQLVNGSKAPTNVLAKTNPNHGSRMESVSAPLVMLVWLLAALVL